MENKFKVAVLDDDKIYLNLIKKKIEKLSIAERIEVRIYKTGRDFMADGFIPNMLILDYHLDGSKYKKGSEVLSVVRKLMKRTMVYMISGKQNDGLIMDLLKNGASDFFEKDASLLSNIVAHLKDEYRHFKEDLKVWQARDIKSKLTWGVLIFGIAPLLLQVAQPAMVPIYVMLALGVFMGYAVAYHFRA